MLKNRLFYIALLISASFVYIFTNTYYTLTLVLFVIILPLISVLFMVFSKGSAEITLVVPSAMEKNNSRFSVVIENKSIIPIGRLEATLSVENQLMDYGMEKKIYVSLQSRQKSRIELSITNLKVGLLSVEVSSAAVYDVFGLMNMKLKNKSTETTIVYPKLLDTEVYMDRMSETMGEAGRYAPDRKGMDNSEIFALRDYVPGDEIRKIHWKLSGKIDKVIIRDASLPQNYSLFLLIELKKESEEVMDAMSELYLSFSRRLLSRGINHNLAWYDDSSEKLAVHELDDFEDMEVAMAEFLMSFPYDEKDMALNNYMNGGYRNSNVTLIYFTPGSDIDKIAEAETAQKMKTICITDKDLGKIDSAEFISVSPSNIENGLPEFMI